MSATIFRLLTFHFSHFTFHISFSFFTLVESQINIFLSNFSLSQLWAPEGSPKKIKITTRASAHTFVNEKNANALFFVKVRAVARNVFSTPGCPCPNYQCPLTSTTTSTTSTTTSTTTVKPESWVLILATPAFNVEFGESLEKVGGSLASLVIDGQGQSREIGFTYESETEVYRSCSLVWHGKMFVFGGSNYKRQISIVDECKLMKSGKQLPFDMGEGSCAIRDERDVIICFISLEYGKNCYRSTSPLEDFTELPSSTFDHRNTRIAVNQGPSSSLVSLAYFSDYLIAVGGDYPGNNSITELLSLSNEWSTHPDYPYGTEYFNGSFSKLPSIVFVETNRV